ncbi:hypothetical protein BDV40DRAFT_280794 [Aspergillus tamarii]|uniref:Uncharacterized protein n=1 Tax=Aspergillus tamarii TaxID=41984 RepID=A0A5N6UD53_ASPTM|nr:hypothetical protein BDV40DRAFT_280794 [Aspergillus tamarii]
MILSPNTHCQLSCSKMLPTEPQLETKFRDTVPNFFQVSPVSNAKDSLKDYLEKQKKLTKGTIYRHRRCRLFGSPSCR